MYLILTIGCTLDSTVYYSCGCTLTSFSKVNVARTNMDSSCKKKKKKKHSSWSGVIISVCIQRAFNRKEGILSIFVWKWSKVHTVLASVKVLLNFVLVERRLMTLLLLTLQCCSGTITCHACTLCFFVAILSHFLFILSLPVLFTVPITREWRELTVLLMSYCFTTCNRACVILGCVLLCARKLSAMKEKGSCLLCD